MANFSAGARAQVRRDCDGSKGGGVRGQRLSSQRGAAAVEFALVLPLLLGMLLGVIEIGLVLYDKAVITHASREGARAGIVQRNPKLSVAEITAIVQQQTQSGLIGLLPSNPPQVSVVQSTPAAYPNTLQVSVQYTFNGLALGALMQALGQPWVLNATTVMVHE